ncbi:MAG: hypothetical protein QG671_3501 [Actinomycetota bacterium]|nr:hypothetical protein [Actinomycetota bacterium]
MPWTRQILRLGSGLVGIYRHVIGDVDTSTIVSQFAEAVYSPSGNYGTGVSVTDDGTPVVVSSATRQTDHSYVYYVLHDPAGIASVVRWSYVPGDLAADSDPSKKVADSGWMAVVNRIGTHLWFNEGEESGHLASVF